MRDAGTAENQQKRAAGMRGKPSRAKNRGCDTSPRASRRVTTSPRTPLGGVVVAAGGVKRCRPASRMRDAGGRGAGEGVKCHAGNGGGRWHKAGCGIVGHVGRNARAEGGEGVQDFDPPPPEAARPWEGVGVGLIKYRLSRGLRWPWWPLAGRAAGVCAAPGGDGCGREGKPLTWGVGRAEPDARFCVPGDFWPILLLPHRQRECVDAPQKEGVTQPNGVKKMLRSVTAFVTAFSGYIYIYISIRYIYIKRGAVTM